MTEHDCLWRRKLDAVTNAYSEQIAALTRERDEWRDAALAADENCNRTERERDEARRAACQAVWKLAGGHQLNRAVWESWRRAHPWIRAPWGSEETPR